MRVTPDTSQEEMSPLKDVALRNTPLMFFTFDTSQEEMSPSNEVAP